MDRAADPTVASVRDVSCAGAQLGPGTVRGLALCPARGSRRDLPGGRQALDGVDVAPHRGLEPFVQRFVDQCVTDGHHVHPGGRGEERPQIDPAQVVTGVEAKSGTAS